MPQERTGLANQKDRKDISGISTEHKMKRYGKWLQSASPRLGRTESWQEAGKEPEETPRIDGECPKNQEEGQGSSLKAKGSTDLLSEEFYKLVL